MDNAGAARSARFLEQAEPAAVSIPYLMRAACVLFGLSLVFAIASSRGLYADGSNWFLQVLEKGSFVASLPCRLFSSMIIQWPLVLAIKLGVKDFFWLRLAFSLGCFLPWPLVMGICWRMSPRHFWIVAVACGAGYLNAAFMAIGEHIVAHAFFWPAVFALLFVRPLTRFAAVMLIVSATVLLCSYESLLFLGPMLAAVAFWRAVGAAGKWERLVFVLAAFLFLGAAGIAVKNVLQPLIPSQMKNFRSGLMGEMDYPAWTVGWSLGWVLLMVVAALPPAWSYRIPRRFLCSLVIYLVALVLWDGYWFRLPRYTLGVVAIFLAVIPVLPEFKKWITHPAGKIVLFGCLLLWGSWPLLMPQLLDASRQYDARFLNLAVPAALLPVAILVACLPHWIAQRQAMLVRFSAGLLLAQSLWHIGATAQWHGYVGMVEKVLASRTGPIRFADTPMADNVTGRQALQFDWWWANPSLSISLTSDKHVKSLLLPSRWAYWKPFDPLDPNQLPKLDRYGIDYSEYLKALAITDIEKVSSWKE